MVTFQQLKHMIQGNPYASLQVLAHRLPPQPIVERFKLPTIRIEAAVIPKKVVKPIVRAPSPTPSYHSSVSEELAPPPTRVLGRVAVHVSEEPTLPTIPSPSPSILREARTEPRTELRTEPRTELRGKSMDPLCIAMERQDAMYTIANWNAKQQLECDEARRLEAQIATLYKEESGRSRGWVKTKLEAYFLPRAAVGSRVFTKDAFDWSKIWEKEGSALLDFLCLAKGIRLAVWADRVVGLWPAADSSKGVGPLYHITSTGILLGEKDILQSGYRLVAPYSVEHSLEKLTLDELDTVAEKLGFALPAKKAEKVRALASARMRLRLV